MYLFRAVDRYGQTVDFYVSETRTAMPSNYTCAKALTIRITGRRMCCQRRAAQRSDRYSRDESASPNPLDVPASHAAYCNNPVESHHRQVKRRLRVMQWATNDRNGGGSQSGHRSGEHDPQTPRSRNHPPQPTRAAWVFGALLGVAYRYLYGCRVDCDRSSLRCTTLSRMAGRTTAGTPLSNRGGANARD
jgi:hypothetical protein